ncbi:peptide/nickel transport system substrate-binding protein [Aliiroseovarius halocynthiae]|uniref:Uncharacterized protein n=1 Tax=Aliiroseovarius halocynthiae TaxID=985055 RepID=A0A545SVZ9_9RHOB|nr:hypothetical protein [Aliiroseovarius halocynthiae]TQV69129.1 hypothetical protein FIL88_06050 [Aliiroseovarius halocynthiae]SMR71886.1 peptide/nickel transport system substrate-binding protein [Aliiroseovarius halocynthiae]
MIENIEIEDNGVYYDSYFKIGGADIYLEYAPNNSDPTYLLYNVFTTISPWGYPLSAASFQTPIT